MVRTLPRSGALTVMTIDGGRDRHRGAVPDGGASIGPTYGPSKVTADVSVAGPRGWTNGCLRRRLSRPARWGRFRTAAGRCRGTAADVVPVGRATRRGRSRGCRSAGEVGAVAAAVVVAPDRDWCSCRWVARWGGAVVFEEELELAVRAVGDDGAGSAGAAGRRGGRRRRCRCGAGRAGAGAVPVRMVVRRASTGWVVRVRPVGSVQVATASVVRVTCQPGRCLTRWWRRHRQSRLSSRVRPAARVGRGRGRRTRRRWCSRGTGSAGRGPGPVSPSVSRAGRSRRRTRRGGNHRTTASWSAAAARRWSRPARCRPRRLSSRCARCRRRAGRR